tara:strand:- start:299 stop:742 length:444 start_codon:yes stop_codon:yes gene_type:complete
MILISHRGNMTGPQPEEENSPEYITKALKKYDVEVDVWYVKGKWYLGHDHPLYPVDFEFLKQKGLWCHAKNIDSLYELIQSDPEVNCFWHQEDDTTLTSLGFLWTYPGKKLTPKSIAVMPEKKKFKNIDIAYGICTDFPDSYEEAST